MVMLEPTGRIRRLAARSTPSTITLFSTSSALPLQTDATLLFLRRHLNQSCGVYYVIK